MYLDYKDFFKNPAVSQLSQAEYESQILAILEKNTENIEQQRITFLHERNGNLQLETSYAC